MSLAYRWHLESKSKCLQVLFTSKNTLDCVCIFIVYNERFTPTCCLVHTGHNVLSNVHCNMSKQDKILQD